MDLLGRYLGDAIDWLIKVNGVFTTEQLSDGLYLKNDPIMAQRVIEYLIKQGSIEPHGNRHGLFIRADDRPTPIDWQNASMDEYPIWLPLWLDANLTISPGNIIVVAGEKNSGKTSFGRRIAYENQKCVGGDHDCIRVLDYESHGAEIAKMNARIDTDHSRWANVDIQRMSRNFHKGIEPNGFNIIDYIKVSTDFYMVGQMIGAIHEKLRDGIAIVFLQKKRGEMFGRGGEFTLEEPRLGLSLFSYGPCKWARATKVKAPRDGRPHLEDMEVDYDLDGRCSFHVKTDWRYVNEKERKRIIDDEMMAGANNNVNL